MRISRSASRAGSRETSRYARVRYARAPARWSRSREPSIAIRWNAEAPSTGRPGVLSLGTVGRREESSRHGAWVGGVRAGRRQDRQDRRRKRPRDRRARNRQRTGKPARADSCPPVACEGSAAAAPLSADQRTGSRHFPADTVSEGRCGDGPGAALGAARPVREAPRGERGSGNVMWSGAPPGLRRTRPLHLRQRPGPACVREAGGPNDARPARLRR